MNEFFLYTTTSLFYTLLIDPLSTYGSLDCIFVPIYFLAMPLHYLTAAYYTLPRGFRRRHSRRRRPRFPLALLRQQADTSSCQRRHHPPSLPRLPALHFPTLPSPKPRSSKSLRTRARRVRLRMNLRSRGRHTNRLFPSLVRPNDSALSADDCVDVRRCIRPSTHSSPQSLHSLSSHFLFSNFLYSLLFKFFAFFTLPFYAIPYVFPYWLHKSLFHKFRIFLSHRIFLKFEKVNSTLRNFATSGYYENNVSAQPNNMPTSSSTPKQFSDSLLSKFLESFDVLEHYHSIQAVLDFTPSTYYRINQSDPRYKPLLLQAKSLQARIFHYDQRVSIPLKDPLVFLSQNHCDLPIIIDTGASCSLTPNATDFTGPLSKADISGLSQVSGRATVAGSGTVAWNIEDQNGVRRKITTNAYFVPSATVRLFSPQVYIGNNRKARLLVDHRGASLTLKCGSTLSFPLNKHSKLPFMLTEEILQQNETPTRKLHFTSFYLGTELEEPSSVYNTLARRSVQHRDNYNLHPDQKELLDWHCRLSHADMQRVQMLLSKPQTPRGATEKGELYPQIISPVLKGASSCRIPKCEACQYAKQRRTMPHNPRHPDSSYQEGSLSLDKLNPGDKLSCDQYMSSTLGRLSHTLGKESKSHQLAGGTIFIDHASNYIFHHHQVNLTAAATVRSKHACEKHFDSFGITIRQYASDNSPFSSKEWIADCSAQHQHRTLTGVGAQHQNYMERHIQVIFNWARASLLHFVLHWPQQAQETLWPFAIDYAVYIWNNLPARGSRLAPFEIFSGNRYTNYHHLQRAHVFGCPVFVLDARLHDSGKKIPKWSMRSRRGIYLGVSPHHNSTVHLVLNPSTGAITPQYHLVFDDTFSTVFSNGQFDEANWLFLLNHGYELHPSLLPDSTGQLAIPPDVTHFDSTPSASEGAPTHDSHVPTVTSDQPRIDSLPQPVVPNNASEGATLPLTSSQSPIATTEEATNSPVTSSPMVNPSPPTPQPFVPRRSSRSTAGMPPQKLTFLASYDQQYNTRRPRVAGSSQVTFNHTTKDRLPRVSGEQLDKAAMTARKWDCLLRTFTNHLGTLTSFIAEHQRNLEYSYDLQPLVDYLNPAILQIVVPNSDTPTFQEAMNGPNAAGFLKAMEIEVDTLQEMNTFEVIDRQPWMKIISSVWALRIKRFPDGSVKKLKARLCARGYEQVHGQDYFETFAPVVQWLTVRLILVVTIILGLENKQIDYTAAFVQAPIDTDVYMEIPQLFAIKGKVWKLRKSIYGLKQSPRNYFLHMKSKLEELGFKQSDSDPCLFISATVICLIYVDDALLVYKDHNAADDLTTRMLQKGMLFNVESDVAGYLGVLIDRKQDGSIIMRQEGLTKRIVEALFLDDKSITPVSTPATAFLPIDAEGEPALGLYNYASVVGMLNYLQGHSRIDIGFAVSQVARFVHSPKRSHELALERIGRYLKGTLDKGLVLRPFQFEAEKDNLHVDIFVDAAFASGWGTELGTNPDSVKSRTGYVIEVMGCSVIWCSKLQTSIATSTMESEYTALSMALRAAIPLLSVCKAVARGLGLQNERIVTFRATLHEDNMGALTLATLEPGRDTPRSKFYALKLHWFRSWLIPNKIQVIFCPTKEQKADYLTKPLTPAPFEACRQLSMGW